jgi:hypothetical protein
VPRPQGQPPPAAALWGLLAGLGGAWRSARGLPSRGGADALGVRGSVPSTPALDLREPVRVTDTRTTDHPGGAQTLLDQPPRLAARRGHTRAFALGSYDPRPCAQLVAAPGPLVTRRPRQARITVEAERPVPTALPGPPRGG